jgi:2,3-bisphosphoglycerate-independent phosphoglycerate mutase
MMASAITDRLVQAIENQSFDFVLANYANPDTIAHTGNYDAALEAVHIIDKEIGRLVKSALNSGAVLLITSDHGNLEEVADPMTGKPETQHDPNPVPLHLIAEEFRGRKFTNYQALSQTVGILSDIAPTVLEIMELPKPPEMTGHSLLNDLLI